MTAERMWRWASRALLVAAGGLLLFHLGVYVAYSANLIAFPFDYDQGEGYELVDVIYFARGEWPYRDVEVFPFYASNYPPLFHLMALPFHAAFGPAYWYGRLLGALGTALCGAVIAYAVWRSTRHRGAAGLAGLAFLASNTVYHIGPLFRQHATMVLFETLAVVVFATALDAAVTRRGRRARLLVGFGLLVAAGYTKQLAAFTALGVLAWLFIHGPRRAIVWGVGFALVGGAIFAWMTWATNGQWYVNAIAANVNTYTLNQTIGLFRLWAALHGALLLPAIGLILLELYGGRLSVYSVWWAASLGGAVGSGAWGAGDSYFATNIAATCLLAGVVAGRTLRGGWHWDVTHPWAHALAPLRAAGPWATRVSVVVVPVLFLTYGAATFKMPTTGPVFGPLAALLRLEPNAPSKADVKTFYDSAGRVVGGYADIGHFVTEADHAAGWEIVTRIRAADGPALTEEAAFALHAGQEVITNPTQLLNLAINDRYDGATLVAMLDAQAFGLVVLRAQFYPPNILQAIARNYAHTDVVAMNGFRYMILERRDVPLASEVPG